MTVPSNRVLRDRFLLLQEKLASCLKLDRTIHHEGEKGMASEAGWREMLADYLPRRYSVAKAFVIDSRGEQSQQLDLVLHDRQFSPFLFNQNDALYIPAESVYAVFEVKQGLDRSTLRDAGEKAASVRKLHRTSAPIPWAGGEAKPRPPIPILAGLLCFGSRWSPPFGDPLRAALADLPELERLDLVCALTHGSFEAKYPGGGAPEFDLSAPDTALIFFFLRLLERLQAVATVPAMEIREYARALEA
ncbi:MAG TPA: DUF6602 domain-containing protein [Thermoanaerobaculia bacterium]|jgi:hypothetical protein|nr:DUF6602 domain-containing protein [Thermoanaerobaculia bacterium]